MGLTRIGEGNAARALSGVCPWVGPVRAAIPCNALGRGRTDMANNPKRIQDPTEAAMSAIQEALNLREDPPAACRSRLPRPHQPPIRSPTCAERGRAPAREGRRRPTRSAPPIDEDLFLQETVGRGAGAGRPRRGQADPARRQRRPPVGRAGSPVAAAPPLARALHGGVLPLRRLGGRSACWSASSYFGTDLRAIARQGVHPTLFALAAGIALPVLLFYVRRPHDPPRAGAAHHRALDDRSRDAACRARDASHASRSCRSGRRSAAKSPRWATASSVRWRAPPNSKRSCTTKSPRWSAPTTTTNCAFAA